MREPFTKTIEARPAIKILFETRANKLICENDVVVGAIAKQGDKQIRLSRSNNTRSWRLFLKPRSDGSRLSPVQC